VIQIVDQKFIYFNDLYLLDSKLEDETESPQNLKHLDA